jgi:hypothetical protein
MLMFFDGVFSLNEFALFESDLIAPFRRRRRSFVSSGSAIASLVAATE